MAGFFRIFVMFLYFLRVFFIDLFLFIIIIISSDFFFQIYSDRFILVFNVLCSICVFSIKFMYLKFSIL